MTPNAITCLVHLDQVFQNMSYKLNILLLITDFRSECLGYTSGELVLLVMFFHRGYYQVVIISVVE